MATNHTDDDGDDTTMTGDITDVTVHQFELLRAAIFNAESYAHDNGHKTRASQFSELFGQLHSQYDHHVAPKQGNHSIVRTTVTTDAGTEARMFECANCRKVRDSEDSFHGLRCD